MRVSPWHHRSDRPSLRCVHDAGVVRCFSGQPKKFVVMGDDYPALASCKCDVLFIARPKHTGFPERQDIDVTAAQPLRDGVDMLVEIEADGFAHASPRSFFASSDGVFWRISRTKASPCSMVASTSLRWAK